MRFSYFWSPDGLYTRRSPSRLVLNEKVMFLKYIAVQILKNRYRFIDIEFAYSCFEGGDANSRCGMYGCHSNGGHESVNYFFKLIRYCWTTYDFCACESYNALACLAAFRSVWLSSCPMCFFSCCHSLLLWLLSSLNHCSSGDHQYTDFLLVRLALVLGVESSSRPSSAWLSCSMHSSALSQVPKFVCVSDL